MMNIAPELSLLLILKRSSLVCTMFKENIKIDKTLVEIQLETGRYHQIRVQFSAIGCPIVGDAKYGSTSLMKNDRIALHSGRLKFFHPVTKAPLNFEHNTQVKSL